ncbi:MAG: hypothetical protein AB7E95_08045 [Kiritimatiellales bacterium]
MEFEPSHITIWKLLSEPWLGLHFPRFALFLMFALFAEIHCDRKKISIPYSSATVLLLLAMGIPATVALYFQTTILFHPGDRVSVPFWYCPLTLSILTALLILFIRGLITLLREQHMRNGITRGIIFGITVYFAVTAIRTPYAINKSLAQMDAQYLSEQQKHP